MGSNWKSARLFSDDPTDLPDLPGCYAIFGDGELVYIGSSENIRSRVCVSHRIEVAHYSDSVRTPWGYFTSLVVKYRLSKKTGDWLMIEYRLIRRLRPRGNRRGVCQKVIQPVAS